VRFYAFIVGVRAGLINAIYTQSFTKHPLSMSRQWIVSLAIASEFFGYHIADDGV